MCTIGPLVLPVTEHNSIFKRDGMKLRTQNIKTNNKVQAVAGKEPVFCLSTCDLKRTLQLE